MTWTAKDVPELSGRVAVVTGGNSGIGWQTARALAAHHATVVLACRDIVRGSEALRRIRTKVPGADVRVAGLDVASLSSVRTFAAQWDGRLDLLVNNAGVMWPPSPTTTEDGFELQFGTNHLGHFALTGLLLPALLEAAHGRVVTVASIAHHGGGRDVLDGNTSAYEPRHTYANSKLANLLFADELERRARAHATSLTSAAAHPGVAATGLFTDREGAGGRAVNRALAPVLLRVFTASPRSGARAVLFAATEAEGGSYTGPQRFGEMRGPIGPARRSELGSDAELARSLWQLSEELTGVTYPWPAT